MFNDEMKEKCGRLIEYERAQRLLDTKDRQYRKKFFLDYNGIQFCEHRTYQRLSRGKVCENDNLYAFLLDKLNVQMSDKRAYYDKEKEYSKQLREFVDLGKEEEAIHLLEEMELYYKPLGKDLYFGKLIEFVKVVHDCLKTDNPYYQFPIKATKELLPIFCEDLQEVLIYFLTQYIFVDTTLTNSEKLEFINCFRLQDKKRMIRTRMAYCTYLYSKSELLQAYLSLKRLEKETLLTDKNRIELLLYEFSIACEIAPNEANKLELEINDIVGQNTINENDKINVLFNMGITKYHKRDFEGAYQIFSKVIHGEGIWYKEALVLATNCEDRLKRNNNYVSCFKENKEYIDIVDYYVQYYYLKFNRTSAKELEMYIYNTPKNIRKFILNTCFVFELEKICMITRSYGKFINYCQETNYEYNF